MRPARRGIDEQDCAALPVVGNCRVPEATGRARTGVEGRDAEQVERLGFIQCVEACPGGAVTYHLVGRWRVVRRLAGHPDDPRHSPAVLEEEAEGGPEHAWLAGGTERLLELSDALDQHRLIQQARARGADKGRGRGLCCTDLPPHR